MIKRISPFNFASPKYWITLLKSSYQFSLQSDEDLAFSTQANFGFTIGDWKKAACYNWVRYDHEEHIGFIDPQAIWKTVPYTAAKSEEMIAILSIQPRYYFLQNRQKGELLRT